MLKGTSILLRPFKEEDLQQFQTWGQDRERLWGSYQRFQLDHVPQLIAAYQHTKLLSRESGFFIIETKTDSRIVGFVRYNMTHFPDADIPYPDIGFVITDPQARGKGYASEAVSLLLDYLFAGYPTQRISAITDADNFPAQKLLERIGFQCEGILRRVSFRDGKYCDWKIYSILRAEYQS